MSIKKAIVLPNRNCNKLIIWFLICTVICTGCTSAGADMMTWNAAGTAVPVQDFAVEEQGPADSFSKVKELLRYEDEERSINRWAIIKGKNLMSMICCTK